MKRVFIILPILYFNLMASDKIIDQDIWERYIALSTSIEWNVKTDHEFYMMDVSRSYSLQSVRNENDKLYALLINSPILEKEVLNAGRVVLYELLKSYEQKEYYVTEKKEKSRVTYYSFSSVN
ncbi:MAG: hypothetical protein CMG42_01715 [Candidatus Marinimicrobia bacterium]|nr:hypothetical protein [Candidatus Neomarinimicrobiota bacterium]